MMKVYLCHQYGGLENNKQWLEKTVYDIFKEYGYEIKINNIIFVSPIHCFGYLYKVVDYDDGMRMCLSLLEDCDYMLTFGKRSYSRGCMIEKEFCKENNIMMVNIDRFKEVLLVDN